MSDYLRHIKNLTGTKVVCAEGDCGACSVVASRLIGEELSPYVSINSCIARMYLYDRCHIITVEGLGSTVDMHPVQDAFVNDLLLVSLLKSFDHHKAQPVSWLHLY
jgi:xanthine dehydrogenase small subunit